MTNTSPGYPESIAVAKAQAKRLTKALTPYCEISHSQSLEVVAKLHAERSWGAMTAHFNSPHDKLPQYDLGLPHHSDGSPVEEREMTKWTSEELGTFVDLLRSHPSIKVTPKFRAHMDKILKEGCVVGGSIDGLLDGISKALGDFAFGIRGERIVELFEIQSESFMYRPSETDTHTIGFQAVPISGAAALLIKLERLGLDTHPEHLVSAVNKASAGRTMVTKHELDCLWYQSERAMNGRQRLTAGTIYWDEDEPHETFLTANGHNCSVFKDNAGIVQMVIIDPPVTGLN